jgi:hypothetical protein
MDRLPRPCPAGLPEEVAHTKACLARGYAVLALASKNREDKNRCFSSSGDPSKSEPGQAAALALAPLDSQLLGIQPAFLLDARLRARHPTSLPAWPAHPALPCLQTTTLRPRPPLRGGPGSMGWTGSPSTCLASPRGLALPSSSQRQCASRGWSAVSEMSEGALHRGPAVAQACE